MDLPPDDPTEPLAKAPRVIEPFPALEARLRYVSTRLKAGSLPPLEYTAVIEEAATKLEELKGDYYELIYAVCRHFEGETRHQTALRYIRECENVQGEPAQEAPKIPYRNVGSSGEAPGSLLDA